MAAPTETKTLTFLLGNGNWKKSYICFCPVLDIDTKKKKISAGNEHHGR